jgi:hypothetical protein
LRNRLGAEVQRLKITKGFGGRIAERLHFGDGGGKTFGFEREACNELGLRRGQFGTRTGRMASEIVFGGGAFGIRRRERSALSAANPRKNVAASSRCVHVDVLVSLGRCASSMPTRL